jgi:hypothetical protein
MVFLVVVASQLFELEIPLSSHVMTVTADLIRKKFMRGRQEDTCIGRVTAKSDYMK